MMPYAEIKGINSIGQKGYKGTKRRVIKVNGALGIKGHGTWDKKGHGPNEVQIYMGTWDIKVHGDMGYKGSRVYGV